MVHPTQPSSEYDTGSSPSCDADHVAAQRDPFTRVERRGGGFVGMTSAPGLRAPSGATDRPVAVPPPGVAPSRAQRRLIERYLRAGGGTDLHRAELRKILAREG